MPNRLLRDLTDSEAYNAMSIHAREFFCPRLINKADNFGLLPADPKWLRPACYPFLLDQVREADLQRLISECEKSGLVRRYEVDGKQFMQIVKFRQRLRNKTPHWPAPPWGLEDDDPPMSDIGQTDVGHTTAETELELDIKKETHAQRAATVEGESFEDQAKKQADAHHFAKNWVNSRFMGSKWCDNSSIRAMGMLVNLIGKERSIAEVDLAATDPEIANPMTTVWSRYDPMRRQRKDQASVKPYKPVQKWQEGVLPDGQKQKLTRPPKAVG